MIKELPDLREALEEYAGNIHRAIDIAVDRGLKICFLTQPTLWKLGMTKEEKQLLWFGWSGDREKAKVGPYYSVEALSVGISEYNGVLRSVCRERKVPCIDLASMLPKDTTVFYDDCHFNESGAQKVAEIISGYLEQNFFLGGY
jgi:hypothetical protein